MMRLQRGHYVSRVYFLYHPDVKMDILGHLWRVLPDGLWTLQYRFRYYEDEFVHDSSDRKSGYEGTFDRRMTEPELLARVEMALGFVASAYQPALRMDVVSVDSDDPRVYHARLSSMPWYSARFEAVS